MIKTSASDKADASGGAPCILLIHGAGASPRNAGDDAQAYAAAERLRRLIPGCTIIFARIYNEDDGSLWPGETLADSPHLYLLGRSKMTHLALKWALRLRLRPLTALIANGSLFTRALRLLFAAWCEKTLGFSFLLDGRGRRALENLKMCDAVYCSGGGNLNDIWLKQELLPRAVTYRAAALLGKPVFVSGQGVGPLKSRLGRWLIKWGVKYVTIFGCRDKKESVALLTSLGVGHVAQSLGDDAMDLAPAPAPRAKEILQNEGVPSDQFPLVAVHVRLTNFSTDFRAQGIPFVAELCDRLIEKSNCFIAFIPISHAKDRAYDHDIGDAFEVFARMRRRERVAFVCGKRYSPPEIKAVVAEAAALVGFSYHAWVFSLSSGKPTFGLYYGEYFRGKSSGLFAWYNQPNWIWDISNADTRYIADKIVAEIGSGDKPREALLAETRSLVAAIERPAILLAAITKNRNSV